MDKKTAYEAALAELRQRLQGERDLTANLANASAILSARMEGVNWAGFYLLKDGALRLGPFQGLAAVTRIEAGSGVCGTALAGNESLVVADVHAFPGHIACDLRSRSEIVIPLRRAGQCVGVLDIDSPLPGRFDREDRQYLEAAVRLLEEGCDF